jgi:hypothetical protein
MLGKLNAVTQLSDDDDEVAAGGGAAAPKAVESQAKPESDCLPKAKAKGKSKSKSSDKKAAKPKAAAVGKKGLPLLLKPQPLKSQKRLTVVTMTNLS